MSEKCTVPFFIPKITEEDKKAVSEALESRWLTGGPKAAEFERLFANYIGTKYAISVNNCTAALHLSMRALDVNPRDEVVVPVLTFAATANAPLFCGAKPVFADIDDKTFNISVEDMQEKITKRTKAVIIVHYGGQPCDMKEIMEIVEDHNLYVIEDCAHATGATYRGKKVGSFGITGCFSFYPTKNITTLEGGMITTNDEKVANRVRSMRSHGITRSAYERERVFSWYYDVTELGYNYRLNEVQAALGISQLKRLDKMNEEKRTKAQYLTKRLSFLRGIIPPYEAKDRRHVYHLYVIRVIETIFGMSRDELFKKLSRKGIGLSVHYTPLHMLSFYKEKFGYKKGDFPVAEEIYKQILSLPIYFQLTKKQMDWVLNGIIEESSS